jgi:hypothetical protein
MFEKPASRRIRYVVEAPQLPTSRRLEVRAGNDRIAQAAQRNKFDRDTPVPFLCECDDPGCREFVRATLGQYEQTRAAGGDLTAPAH